MKTDELVNLKRDCNGIQIPTGVTVKLKEGMPVKITQSLGGFFTIVTQDGYMLEIAGEDADALGKEIPPKVTAEGAGPACDKPLDQLVWDALKTCYDPEIPVNIVDLGLIYECKIVPLPDGGNRADVKMTLTAPGCGMAVPISMDARSKILAVPGIKEAAVDIVWDPPWDQGRMSQAAKLKLGML